MGHDILTYLGNLKMCAIDGDKGMSTLIRLFGIHEPNATEAVLKMLKSDMVVVDIGANLGYYAFIEARAVGDNGHVYALEPSPESYECLESGVEANGFVNVSTYQMAIGNKDGLIEMNLGQMSNSSNVLDLNSTRLSKWAVDHLTNSMAGTVTVPIQSLDSFVKANNIKQIDMLRMDVEGYEIQIMRGARKTISSMSLGSFLFIELHPIFYKDRSGYKKMYQSLTRLGFKPYTANDNGDLLPVTLEKILETDVLHTFWIREHL